MYSILNDLYEEETGSIYTKTRPAFLVYEEETPKNDTEPAMPERVLYVKFGAKYTADKHQENDAKRHAKKMIARHIYEEFLDDIHLILDRAYAGDTDKITDIAKEIIAKINGDT